MYSKLSTIYSHLLKNHYVLSCFGIFLFFHLISYSSLLIFQKQLPLSSQTLGTFIYVEDERFSGGDYNFFRSLIKADAQWYLYIADHGYPLHPDLSRVDFNNQTFLSYAFFPLYPIFLHLFTYIFQSSEIAAFIFSNIVICLCFLSFYILMQALSLPKSLFFKVAMLLFFSPFSIFFRAPFSESLSLLTLIWFLIFFIQKKDVLAAFFLGINFTTRAVTLLLVAYYLFSLLKKPLPITKKFSAIFFLTLPISLWLLFNFQHSGNAFAFIEVRKFWFSITQNSHLFSNFILIPFYNILLLFSWLKLPFHGFNGVSKLDTSIFVLTIILLWFAKKTAQKDIWISGVCVALLPFFVTTFMSYCRYSLLILPVFFFIAQKVKGFWFKMLWVIFFATSLCVNIAYINGYWIG